MGNVWWISLFMNIMSFHRLHNPFCLNGPSFSFRASFWSGGISLGHIFTTLIGINDILISFSPPFFLPSILAQAAAHLDFTVINTTGGTHRALWVPSGARPWSFFSLVQHGSALPASLRHGIEQSIKVYLSICQLQWAVWWALIGQAFLCFSSWRGYDCSSRTQTIKTAKPKHKLTN